MHRHKDDVAGLQPNVGGVAAAKQIIVEIETVDERAAAANLDLPEAAVGGGAAGGVERVQHGAGARDLVGARPDDVARHVDLDVPEPGERELKPGRPVPVPPDPGVHPAEAAGKLCLELTEREVGHVDLAHLRDDHEPFAGHLQGVGPLHVAGEDEHEHVPGAEPVVLVDGARLGGLESCRAAPEGFDAEQLEPAAEHRDRVCQRVGAERIGAEVANGVEYGPQRIGHDHRGIDEGQGIRLVGAQHPQGANRVERARAQLGRLRRVGTLHVVVEHALGIARGTQARAHLVGGEAGLLEPLAKLLHELRLGAQHLLRLVGRRKLLAARDLRGQGRTEYDEGDGQDRPYPGGQDPTRNRAGHGGRR